MSHKKKDLVLITRGFPFGRGEAFLENEIEFLSKNFDSIYVFSQMTFFYTEYFDINESRNSPYKGFLENIVTEDTDINGCEHIFNPKEGDIFVFPAYLSHEVGCPDDIPDNELDNLEWSAQKFKTYEQLQHSRFCVGCDAIITRRDTESYENLLLPVEMWKQY